MRRFAYIDHAEVPRALYAILVSLGALVTKAPCDAQRIKQ